MLIVDNILSQQQMKVTLLTRDFSKMLSTGSRFVANRANLPILSNVSLKATKAKLEIQATDLEISFSGKLGAKITEEGEIALSAKTFSELIGNLGGEQIELETNGEVVTVTAEGFKSAINAVNTADYPSVATEVSEGALKLQTSSFIPALNKVLFAISTDEARPTLTGVLFLIRKNEMVLVATDGFRLSQKRFDVETGLPDGKLIIPKRILSEIPRLATGTEVFFEMRESDNQVLFGLPSIVMGSRVIEGEFPNFDRIIPKSTKVTINLSRDEFGRAVKLSSIFARDNANTIKLSIKEHEVVVSAQSSKSGEEELSIPASVEGEQMELSFNYRYIEELLTVVGGESITIKANDATTACLFLDPKDTDFLHLIMPVRA